MFHRLAPMLIVTDVEQAVNWYVETLGGSLHYGIPECPPYDWVSLYLDGVEIMFAASVPARRRYTDSVVVSELPSNLIVYIYVSDAPGLYEKVRGKAEVIMAPVDQPYGVREFAIRDPFGFVLVFAQEIQE